MRSARQKTGMVSWGLLSPITAQNFNAVAAMGITKPLACLKPLPSPCCRPSLPFVLSRGKIDDMNISLFLRH